MFRAVSLLLACVSVVSAVAPPSDAMRRRLSTLADLHRAHVYAITLYQRGKFAESKRILTSVVDGYQRMFPEASYPQGHHHLASAISNLGALCKAFGDFENSQKWTNLALQMRRKLFPVAAFPQGHADLANSLNNYAQTLETMGKLSEAQKFYEEALAMNRRLYPKAKFPNGHSDLVSNLGNLAFVLERQSKPADAEKVYSEALAMVRKLYPKETFADGHEELAWITTLFADFLHQQENFPQAERLLREAVAMNRRLYSEKVSPQGHPILANSLGLHSRTLASLGEFDEAEKIQSEALVQFRKLYPGKHFPLGSPELAGGLVHSANLCLEKGDSAKAEEFALEALAMLRRLYPEKSFPQGHPDIASCVSTLAAIANFQGDSSKAEKLCRSLLAMHRQLYPAEKFKDGHPKIATALNQLGTILRDRGEPDKAEKAYQESLEIWQKMNSLEKSNERLTNTACVLMNLCNLLDPSKDNPKAVKLARQALEMFRAAYPKEQFPRGSVMLAFALNHLGVLLSHRGEFAKSLELQQESLLMFQKLHPQSTFPEGHWHLVMALSNLGATHFQHGESAKAEQLLGLALKMDFRLGSALAEKSSEAVALNHAARQPLSRDGYLSATRDLPKVDAYPVIWRGKAAISRIFEQRHLAILTAESPKASELWREMLVIRRRREALILSASPLSETREKQLAHYEEQLAEMQRNLLRLLPPLANAEKRDKATPKQLQQALPTESVVVDLLRYTRFEYDAKWPTGRKRTQEYLAFVVRKDKIIRVELGEAKAIEETVKFWREAITEGSDEEICQKYAAKVHRLVWTPLSDHIPASTKTIFISADSALTRVPWAALPGRAKDTVLLEDHALINVPHGVFLLDQLTREKAARKDKPTLLAMGDVAFDEKAESKLVADLRGVEGKAELWPKLKGTSLELERIGKLAAGMELRPLRGSKATQANLLAELPKANIAHLATHGFFADSTFRSVLQLDEKLFARREFEMGSVGERIGAGAKSPLLLSGLVCAGANVKDTPNRGILSADAIVGLDLRKLELAVRSACETGLGDVAGGEGVYGLTKAFHIAGARNVVASLWKVEDQATAALMVLFYRNLWERKLSPAESLRQAQLSVFRNPEMVPAWSEGRGPLLKVVVSGERDKKEMMPKGKFASTKIWAAFVVSGVGD